MIKKRRKSQTNFEIRKKSTNESMGDYFPKKKSHKFFIVFYREIAKENLILGLIGEMDQSNRIIIDARLKSVLAHSYGTSPGFIQKTFNRMVSKKWALRLSRGQYFISPYLFFKADLDRIEYLKSEYDKLLFEQNQSPKDTKRRMSNL